MLAVLLTGCEPIDTTGTTGTGGGGGRGKGTAQTGATVQITTSKKTCWSGQIGGTTRQGCGSTTIRLTSSSGSYTVNIHKTKGSDGIAVVLRVNGKKVDSGRSSSSSVVSVTSSSR
jgi:hypothetical protein